MNYHIQYSKPKKNDICVAYIFFNPCGYVRPLQNAVFFENKLRLANIPYFSAEMIIGDQTPMLSNPTCVYRSSSYLFYKEELFNKLETFIPEEYTKIIFLDADIIFNIIDWVDKLSILLDTHDIVQVFERACYLDLTYNENHWVNSSISDYNPSGTGFGWAINRSFLHRIGGFFDKCTLGSGDSIFFHSIVNRITMKYPLIQEYINEYRKKIATLNPKWTFLGGVNIYHLSHGSRVNRKYIDRYTILSKMDFTWDHIFYKNDDGFWELRDSKINMDFLNYFKNRNEDSVCSFTTKGITSPTSELKKTDSVDQTDRETNIPLIKSQSKESSIPIESNELELKSESDSLSNLETPVKTEASVKTQVKDQPKAELKTQVKVQPKAEPKAQLKPQAKAESQSKLAPRSSLFSLAGMRNIPNIGSTLRVPSIPRVALVQQMSSAPGVSQIPASPHKTVSQAAAIKSLEKRENLRNTVVYTRTNVTPVKSEYDSDDYYSD